MTLTSIDYDKEHSGYDRSSEDALSSYAPDSTSIYVEVNVALLWIRISFLDFWDGLLFVIVIFSF